MTVSALPDGADSWFRNEWSLAISEVSRPELLDKHLDVRAETPSITRLEGSRWRGGRLWSYKQDPGRGVDLGVRVEWPGRGVLVHGE